MNDQDLDLYAHKHYCPEHDAWWDHYAPLCNPDQQAICPACEEWALQTTLLNEETDHEL